MLFLNCFVLFSLLLCVSSQMAPKLNPFISKQSQNLNSKFKLLCILQEGFKPARFEWHKDGRVLLEFNSNYRIETEEDESEFTILKLDSNDSGNYSCSVWNDFGTDTQSKFLTVQGLIFGKFCLFNNMWRG